MVRCGEECILPRPFSIHQLDNKGNMALFFAVLEDGKGTNWLSLRHVGDTVELFGPLGNGYTINPRHLLPTIAKLITTTEDGTDSQKGMVTNLLPDFISSSDQAFACGPISMYRDMASRYHPFLKDKPVQVSLEMRMGCGLGVCYGCTVKTKRGLKQVCQDGPVFDLDDIFWDELSCV